LTGVSASVVAVVTPLFSSIDLFTRNAAFAVKPAIELNGGSRWGFGRYAEYLS